MGCSESTLSGIADRSTQFAEDNLEPALDKVTETTEKILKPYANYTITVQTGADEQAGTDSQLYITIYGANGSTNEHDLGSGYIRSTLKVLNVECRDVGIISKIRIRSKGSGADPAWQVNYISVQVAEQTCMFPCDFWLDSTSGLERELTPVQ